MTDFVECSTPSITYRQIMVTNRAVNLSLCITLKRSSMNWYPDTVGLPSIAFETLGGKEVIWAYKKEADRDADYAKLVNHGKDNGKRSVHPY